MCDGGIQYVEAQIEDVLRAQWTDVTCIAQILLIFASIQTSSPLYSRLAL